MSTPRSVAAAREVSLFASALPGSSLCLLVCLRVLLAGVLLGFSVFGCSSGWVVAVSFPGLVFCQWAERPCTCCPGLLAGCSCFLPGGRFPFCWLCLGLRVSSPSFHSPRPRSHSLSLCLSCSSLSPLGFYWLGLVSVLATFMAWIVPRHLMVAYLLVSLRFFPVALSHLPGGVRLFCFAGRPSNPFFWFIRGIRCSSWLSPLHSARFWFIVFSVPCGWVGALLPSLRPAPGLSLFGLLAVPQFLLSQFLAVCFPGLWVSLFPGSFLVLGSSFLVLVFYSFLLRGTRGGIWILPSAPLGCFILLSRLVSCFCFLRRLFRLFSWFQGFLSYFSDLVFCSSQSCLGLQWFWSSCPFRCWGSR